MPAIRALGWDHPRCMAPMRACSAEWERGGHGALSWSTRSLEAFGDEPLEQLAANHDLLVIDHPFCGAAARSGCLMAFDDLLPAELLAALERDAVGPSQSSYQYEHRTWALACDAACQVSAFGDEDLASQAPQTWPQAIALARSLGARAALPLAPAHAISSLLTLWAGSGVEPLKDGELVDAERGLQAVEWLIELHRTGHPQATRMDPPQAFAALASGELDYVPLAYGYVNYADGSLPGRSCRFCDIPGPTGAVLGGAGLAVSAASQVPEQAAAFAAWACSAEVQRTVIATHGGQPASASCWEDAALDARSGGFYSATRATLEGAWVRPRAPWWPEFQIEAGRLLSGALEARAPARLTLERLLALHRGLVTDGVLAG